MRVVPVSDSADHDAADSADRDAPLICVAGVIGPVENRSSVDCSDSLKDSIANDTPAAETSVVSLRWQLALTIALTVICTFAFFRKSSLSEFESCFLRAADHMRAGEPIHQPHVETYSYPPLMAWLAIPFAALPAPWSLRGWFLVNLGCTFLTLIYGWKLAGGPSRTRIDRQWLIIGTLATIVSLRFVVEPLLNHQFDMVITALLFYGCWRVARGQDVTGSIFIGLAAGMKCTPLLMIPYFLWRRQVRPACLVGAVALGANLLPDLFYAQTQGHSYLADWCATYLSYVGSHAPGQWFSDLKLNQSLSGLFHRLLRDVGHHANWANPMFHQVSQHLTSKLRWITYGTGLGLSLITLWKLRAWPDRSSPVLPHSKGTEQGMGRDLAALVCLMLLLSPMSSKAHYVFLWLPSVWLARHCVVAPSRVSYALYAFLLLTGPLSTKGLVGKSWGDTLLVWGLPTWFVVAELAGLWRLSGDVMQQLTQTAPTEESEQQLAPYDGDLPLILPFPTTNTTNANSGDASSILDRRRVA